MKDRWIGGLAAATVLALAACAPTQQGADETPEPSETASPAATVEAEHSMDMSSPDSGGGGGDPDDYDY
jgi:type IV pilus biogenesis protein CpaD/CtpE